MLPTNIAMAIGEIVPFLRGWGGKWERPNRMAELILKEKPNVVVEIGVFGGQSLIPMAMALKANGAGRIYGIDPYNLEVIKGQMSEMDDKEGWLKQDMGMVLTDTFRWLKELELQDYATLILCQSQNCSTLFPLNSIDILHIDGAHTEEGVMLDVNLYAKRVRPGGYIWMDDTHFPSLKPALDELSYFCDKIDDWGGYQLWRHR